MEIAGQLKFKKDEQQISDKFKKREFCIVDASSQYSQTILFQLTQDRCSLIDPINVGDTIKVFFNLRGREWTDPKNNEVKIFNSLEAWRIEVVSGGTNTSTPKVESSGNVAQSDDLPF